LESTSKACKDFLVIFSSRLEYFRCFHEELKDFEQKGSASLSQSDTNFWTASAADSTNAVKGTISRRLELPLKQVFDSYQHRAGQTLASSYIVLARNPKASPASLQALVIHLEATGSDCYYAQFWQALKPSCG
jgi:hypothetical protein